MGFGFGVGLGAGLGAVLCVRLGLGRGADEWVGVAVCVEGAWLVVDGAVLERVGRAEVDGAADVRLADADAELETDPAGVLLGRAAVTTRYAGTDRLSE